MHLDIAVTRYDDTMPLFDGSVAFDGLDVTLHSPAIPEIFDGVASGRFDVAEFGLTHYLRALDTGTDLIALPVFPARVFRHSSVFVNTSAGITGPADLVGRTIGEYGMYGQDSGIWAKGILSDDFGFAPKDNRWVVGGLETPLDAGFEFTTHPHPDGVEIDFAPPGRVLADMLAESVLDAPRRRDPRADSTRSGAAHTSIPYRGDECGPGPSHVIAAAAQRTPFRQGR